MKRALTSSATILEVRLGPAVAADPQGRAVRRLAGVGKRGPDEDVFEHPAGANAEFSPSDCRATMNNEHERE